MVLLTLGKVAPFNSFSFSLHIFAKKLYAFFSGETSSLGILETSFRSLAQFKCLLNKAVLVFFYSSREVPMYIKKVFKHMHFIYRSKPVPCIFKVDIFSLTHWGYERIIF